MVGDQIIYKSMKYLIRTLSFIAIYTLSIIPCWSSTINNNLLVKKSDIPDQINIGLILNKQSKKKVNDYLVFNIPLPPGLIKDTNNLSIYNASNKSLTFYAEPIVWWKYLNTLENNSIRALKIFLKVDNFHTIPDKLDIKINFENPPENKIIEKPLNVEEWTYSEVLIGNKNTIKSKKIREPIVYSTYSPEWLSLCLLRSRTLPTSKSKKLKWFDKSFLNFSNTVYDGINRPKSSPQKFDISDYEPWMYDLAATIFNLYIKTGDVKWLKQAHLLTQIYSSFINESGQSTLKQNLDLKHSYNLSMLIDYILIGDASLKAKIEHVAKFTSNWREDYKLNYGFWTERHQTYSLLGALVAWEATGEPIYAKRAAKIAKTTILEAKSPENGWESQGCILHTIRSHEGDADDRPACSPWMSALLSDAMLRYYIQSRDEQALHFLYELAVFTSNYGIYEVTNEVHMKNMYVPWYLASKTVKYTDDGPWGDREHACDVSGLLAKGLWAGHQINQDTKSISRSLEKLLYTCRKTLDRYYVTSKKNNSKYWKIYPARKFNWWFGSTSDLTYLYLFK